MPSNSLIVNSISEYNQAEVMIHRASQYLSLTGDTLVPHEPDDSHTTAMYNGDTGLLMGRRWTVENQSYQLGLDIERFSLVLVNERGDNEHLLPLDGKSSNEIKESWINLLGKVGYQGDIISTLHYDLPESEAYQSDTLIKPTKEVLKNWMEIRSLANQAMEGLLLNSDQISEINIWPHHFDTGIYLELHQSNGETDRSVGAGLAVADSMIPGPYFYIYGWNKDKEIDYSTAPALESGRWQINSWKGAVLAVDEISTVHAATVLSNFFKTTYTFFANALLP